MKTFMYIKDFGFLLFISKVLRRITLKSNTNISWCINKFNEQLMENKLIEITKSVQDEIDMQSLLVKKNKSVPENPIWIMWYQGIDKAPDIVKCCVNSIKKHCGKHEVIILTEDNLNDYIELPKFVWEKFYRGIISRTHLSDMVRLNVLSLYGGGWLDATILCTNDIPEFYFEKNIFSINFGEKTKDPSHGRWTTFCFFSKKGNGLIKDTLELHYKYWYRKNSVADYVMFDYFISYLVKNNLEYNCEVNDIERSNQGVFTLLSRMNDFYEGKLPIEETTIFYKLSWKRNYEKMVEGKLTVYSAIINEYNNETNNHML